MNTEHTFIVITGDIIGSKNEDIDLMHSIPDRLKKIDEALNTVLPSARFAGDEIQCIFEFNQRHPYFILFNMITLFQPLSLKFGIGIGEIDKPMPRNLAEATGAAFRLARKGLNIAEKRGQIAWCQSDDKSVDKELNGLFCLTTALIQNWTSKHWRRFQLYYVHRNIHHVAFQEDVSPEAINKFIRNAGMRNIITALDQFERSKST